MAARAQNSAAGPGYAGSTNPGAGGAYLGDPNAADALGQSALDSAAPIALSTFGVPGTDPSVGAPQPPNESQNGLDALVAALTSALGGGGASGPSASDTANAQIGLNTLRDQIANLGQQNAITNQQYGLQNQGIDISNDAFQWKQGRANQRLVENEAAQGAIGSRGQHKAMEDIYIAGVNQAKRTDIAHQQNSLSQQSSNLSYGMSLEQLNASISQTMNSFPGIK